MKIAKDRKPTPHDVFVEWYNEHFHDFNVNTIKKDETYVDHLKVSHTQIAKE